MDDLDPEGVRVEADGGIQVGDGDAHVVDAGDDRVGHGSSSMSDPISLG